MTASTSREIDFALHPASDPRPAAERERLLADPGFGQVFTEFSGRMAAPYRMQKGQAHIKTYAAAFARAEKEYGVPPAVIAAFWGLESDFGSNAARVTKLIDDLNTAADSDNLKPVKKALPPPTKGPAKTVKK